MFVTLNTFPKGPVERSTMDLVDASSQDKASESAATGISDATFGTQLRDNFLEAASVIRQQHGITELKEPGEDQKLDFLVNETIMSFQRLKVRLLKASNQEAQFRLDLETRVAQGIWNQYDISDDASKEGDFVVYHQMASTTSPRHSSSFGKKSESASSVQQRMRPGRREESVAESFHIDSSLHEAPQYERGGYKMSSAEAKRSASGKFEKNQVLHLTEWLLKNSSNPYPSMDDKADLAQRSGLSTQQVQNWFINMRKRHWTPMMNGKRRPRTFLDYVILSSQKGGKDGSGPSAKQRKVKLDTNSCMVSS